MAKIEDVAIDRSWSYKKKHFISKIKFFFQHILFENYYMKRLENAIKRYEEENNNDNLI